MTETTASELPPQRTGKLLASDPYSRTFGERWEQNRCTQLLGFACLIFVVGTLFLLYRQNRFVPVEFPSKSIAQAPVSIASGVEAITAKSVLIEVVGALNDEGGLRIAIYDSEAGFNDPVRAFRKATLGIRGGEAMLWVPVDILPETFAIAVFHDENENGELDRSVLGVPEERYGFSNDARGMTGPPSYEDAKIDCPKVGQSIKISIR